MLSGLLPNTELFTWLILLKFLQISIAPHLKGVYKRYAEPIAYPLSLLLLLFFSLLGALFKLPVWTALLPFIALLMITLLKGDLIPALKTSLPWDFTLLLFFCFTLGFRYMTPVISTFTEQFMDHAIIASIMREQVVPPHDPWFAGKSLDFYYYFGHWIFAMLGLFSRAPSPLVFNLVLPTVFGTTAVSIHAVSDLLLKRFRWIPLSVLLIIPLAFPYHLLLGDSPYWALNASRWVRSGIITEYPFFSLLLGDAHAHVISLLVQGLMIFLAAYIIISWPEQSRIKKFILSGTAGLALGMIPGTNSWDIFIYAPLILGAVFYASLQGRRDDWVNSGLLPGILYSSWTAALTCLIAAPFVLGLNTETIIGWTIAPRGSEPLEFLLYPGIFILIIIPLVISEVRSMPYLLIPGMVFLFTGFPVSGLILLLLFCSVKKALSRRDPSVMITIAGLLVFFILEWFTFIQRVDQNPVNFQTYFKFSYPGFLLLGTGAFLLFALRIQEIKLPKIDRVMKDLVVTVCLICFLLLPFLIPVDIGAGLLGIKFPGGYQTLDGLAYRESIQPGEQLAVSFMRAQPGHLTILEAVGGDYGNSSRVSTSTGIPTVLGQPSHEFQWRDGDWFWQRQEDVKTMYENPVKAKALYAAYNVTHIWVGDLERDQYKVRLPYDELLCIYNHSEVQIYQVIKRRDISWTKAVTLSTERPIR